MTDLAAAFLELPIEVAVLDRRGVIRRVNDAWRRFARENGAPELAEQSVGLDYLTVCRNTTGPEAELAREAEEGIEAVLRGALPSFWLEYPCHSPATYRTYRLDVVPVAGGKRGAIMTHTKLTEFKRPRKGADEVSPSLMRTFNAVIDKITQVTTRQSNLLSSMASRTWGMLSALAGVREAPASEGEVEPFPRFFGPLDEMADPIAFYGLTGHLVQVNRAYIELFALDRSPSHFSLSLAEQMQLLQVRNVSTGRPVETEETAVTRALRGEVLAGENALDVHVRTLDGREVEVNVTASPVYAGGRAGGHIVGVVVMLRDVTERRRMERDLAAWAGRMEATLSTMQDGVTLTDAHGRILLRNPAFTALFAIERDPTILSCSPEERGARLAFSHPDGGPPLTAEEMPATQALQGNVLAGSHALEIHARALDGRALELSVSAVPLRNGNNRIVGAVTVYRDVAERREYERERRHMMNLVAHELRHPLAILRMADDIIRKDFVPSDTTHPAVTPPQTAQPEKLRELLDFVARGVDEMDHLVQDLVDAARMESGHLTVEVAPTDLAALVRQVAEEEMSLRGNVIQVEAPQRRIMVTVDPARISQVLTNLLTNAYKYSPKNVPVHLRLKRRRGEVQVEVHDEGPGIPPEAQAHVFERFYRVPGTKPLQGAGGGLGLGLYLCRQLVQLHGGQIEVESPAGQGTTFRFTLPLQQKSDGDADASVQA